MTESADSPTAVRLRQAFELYDLGLEMMLQNLRRQFPDEGEAQLQQRLLDWRLHRVDAPLGDGAGRLVPFPRQQA